MAVAPKRRQSVEVLQTLYQISQDLNAARDEDEILQVLIQPALEAGAFMGHLSYIDLNEAGDPNYLEIVASLGQTDDLPSVVGQRLHWADYGVSEFWRTQPDQPLCVANAATDPRLDAASKAHLAKFGVGAEVTVPFRQAGRWAGMITFDWAAPHQFSETELEIYHALPALAAPVVESHRLVKKLEQQIEERTADINRIYEVTMDMVGMAGFDGFLKTINPAWEKTLGYTEAELLAKPFVEFVHPDDIAATQAEAAKLSTGVLPAVSFENRYRCKDGSYKWLSWNTVPDAKKQLLYFVARDISGRKQAEDAQRESEKRYHGLFDNAPIGLYRSTPTGQILDVNPAFVQMLNYPDRQTLLTVNAANLYVNPMDRQQWRTLLEQTGIVRDFNVEFRRYDGSTIWVRNSCQVIRDDQGQVVYYEGSLEDVTEQKQAEEALRESEQRLAEIIDFLPDATFAIDQTGKVIAWNRAIEELTGVKADQILGKGDYEYALPFYQKRRPILIDLVFKSDDEIKSKYDFVTKEGDILVAEANMVLKGKNRILWGKAVPLYDSRGNIVGAIEAIRDVTEERETKIEAENQRRTLQTVLDYTPLGVFMVEAPSGKVIVANKAAGELLGRGIMPEAEKNNLNEVYNAYLAGTDELYPTDKMPLVQGMMGRSTRVDDMEIRRPDGQNFLLEIIGTPIIDAAGKLTASMAIFMDITQRKQAEEELRRFKLMIENAPDAIGIATMTGDLSYTNPAFQRMSGYGEAAKDLNIIQLYNPADLPMIQEYMEEAMSRGWWQGSITWHLPGGRTLPVYGTVFPIRDSAGQPVATVAFFQDRTEQLRAEVEREQLQQEIIEAQRRAIQELSTPIIPVMDRIIVMPLIGSIDSLRAKDITRTLLAGISQYRAKVVILDVTGVGIVDTGVAGHLNKTIQAARLKGTQAIVTGISDAVAETIVDLGIDWSGVQTLSNMQTGLVAALKTLGLHIQANTNTGQAEKH